MDALSATPYIVLVAILVGGIGLVVTVSMARGAFSTLLLQMLGQIKNTESLPDLLLWSDFYDKTGDDFVLLRNANLLALMEIDHNEADLSSDDEINAKRNDYHSILQNVPVGYSTSIHFIRRKAEPVTVPLAANSEPVVRKFRAYEKAMWDSRRQNMYQTRVIITLERRTGGVEDSFFSALIGGKHAMDWKKLHTAAVQFGNVWNGIVANAGGFARVHKLNKQEIFSLFYYYMNPENRDAGRIVQYNPAYRLGEQLCDGHFENGGGDLIREEQGAGGRKTFFRVMTMNTLPGISYPTLFEPMTELGSKRAGERLSEYWVTQHYQPEDPEKRMLALNIQRNVAETASSIKFMKNLAQKAGQLAEDVKDFTDAVQKDKEGVGQFSMFCVAYDHNMSRLDTTVNRILAEVTGRGARFVVETKFARFPSFLSSLPGHSGLNLRQVLNYRQNLILNAHFADMGMVFREDAGTPNGGIIFETTEGSFWTFDPWDPRSTNANGYVAGTSGAGKSYLMNKFIFSERASVRPITYILDIGNSYDPQIQMAPGSSKVTVDYSNPDIRLNPFAFPADPDQMERVNLARLLEQIITGGQKTLDQSDRVDVQEALKLVMVNYSPANPPMLKDYHETLNTINPKLAKPLRLWIDDGPYAIFFSHKTDSFKESDLVYFELTGFDAHPDVASVIVYMLFTKIFQRMQRPQDAHRKKLILLDECWKFLMTDTMAGPITELYRTVRKHNGVIWTITESPLDLIHSKYREGILANTAHVFFLEQRGIGEEAREAFKLNPREYHIMQSVRMKPGLYSEAMYIGPGMRRQIRVLVDPHSNWVFTTNPKEKQIRQDRVDAKVAQGHNPQEALALAVDELVAEAKAYPNRREDRGGSSNVA